MTERRVLIQSVLFVASAVVNWRIDEVTKAMMPFFVALFTVLLMVTYLPWLSLWLPRTMGL
ncbi:TRAP transporter large permease subunit [Limnohabitans sp. Rim8]|uniref:TRAP transporter large permease subunit n=1 Tax=Limnohabitans sp. Rim8 TaxID=1100718 RepID=UPI0025FF7E6B|nr:TRAP transporter large permease subunit [Limnohabitans sp. Rim8]